MKVELVGNALLMLAIVAICDSRQHFGIARDFQKLHRAAHIRYATWQQPAGPIRGEPPKHRGVGLHAHAAPIALFLEEPGIGKSDAVMRADIGEYPALQPA